jgi:thiol-disulfide isomerase/thioredoxin
MVWRNRSFLLICVLCTSAVLAQGVEDPAKPMISWAASYAKGMAQARAQKRPVLIKFTAEWCGWCERMDVEVFVEAPVIKALEGTTCIKVDVDEHPDVAMAYGVRSLPRVLVINTHQEVVGDWLGYQRSDRFLALLLDLEPALHTKMGTTMAPKVIPPLPKAGPDLPVDLSGDPALTLGHRDPKVREKAMALWVARGVKALPEIVTLLEHPYLGVRIGAWALVQALHPSKVPFDPWLLKPDRIAMIKAINDEHKAVE